jgi:hypothetical protein
MKLSEGQTEEVVTNEGENSKVSGEQPTAISANTAISAFAVIVAGCAFAIQTSGIGREALMSHGALCASAVVIKLAGSVDDAVWLMPFFCGSSSAKLQSACVYVGLFLVETCCCSIVTRVLAFILSFLLPQSAVDAGWDVPCVMQVLSGLALGFYGYKLLSEWLAGGDDDDDDNGDDGDRGVKQLLIIGVLGSLDDMCIQASLLSSGAFAVGHLLVGVFFGCIVVVGICWGASTLSFVLKAMEKVPLWAIVSCLALYSFASALFGW